MRGLRAAGLRALRRRAVHGRAPGLHHRTPVGLLVVAGADHVDLALQPEQRAREGQRRTPLAGAGLGDELADPGLRVLVGLRHRRVRLVRARGREALVLVEDLRRRAELLLEAARAEQRRRAPQPVGVAHRVRDRDQRLGRDLLHDQPQREDRREVVGAGGLAGLRAQRRQRLTGQVREQVDPVRRDGVLAQDELRRLAHGATLLPGATGACGRASAAAKTEAALRRRRARAAVLAQRHRLVREAAVDVVERGIHRTTHRLTGTLRAPWGHLADRPGASRRRKGGWAAALVRRGGPEARTAADVGGERNCPGPERRERGVA